MKQNPDSYLLYECGKFITFSIRLKLVMRDAVDPAALNTAAQKAFRRFPYYAKEIRIDQDGCIDLIPNDRPLAVTPTKSGHPVLGGPEANYHLCSIDYQGDTIYFNMYHGLCGGCGVMFWIKSTLYHYVEEAYGVSVERGNIKTADTPFIDGEMAYPDPGKLSDDEPLGEVEKGMAYIPALDYARQFVTTPFQDTKYFELELNTDQLIKYARSNDGSPNSILAALMFKAVCKVTNPKIAKAIRGNILCNHRADLGCPETYHDLIRLLSVYYPRDLEDKDIEYISTVTRSLMYMQMQPEFSTKTFMTTYRNRGKTDERKGFLSKKLYAMTHSSFVTPPIGTFLISYVGKENWGGLEEYVKRIHCITDGHLMVEVNTIRDKFCLTFMELNKDHKFYDAFLEAMREEGIHYTEYGCYDRQLAYAKLPKKRS